MSAINKNRIVSVLVFDASYAFEVTGNFSFLIVGLSILWAAYITTDPKDHCYMKVLQIESLFH